MNLFGLVSLFQLRDKLVGISSIPLSSQWDTDGHRIDIVSQDHDNVYGN